MTFCPHVKIFKWDFLSLERNNLFSQCTYVCFSCFIGANTERGIKKMKQIIQKHLLSLKKYEVTYYLSSVSYQDSTLN